MKKVYLMLIACAFMIAIVSIPRGFCYHPAGTDTLPHTTATIQLHITSPHAFNENITATGPTTIARGTPYNPGDGHMKINTAMVSMNLVGTSAYIGPVKIFINPSTTSNGTIRQVNAGSDFPADSFFDVFVEINTTLPPPYSTLHYDQPVLMHALIHGIPPWNTTYVSNTTTPIPLKDMNNVTIGSIQHVAHDTGPSPLAVTISPLSATLYVGQSVTFTSTVTNATPPYIDLWCLNGTPVLGANGTSWTFTPSTPGIYYIWTRTTDGSGWLVVSATATIDVLRVPTPPGGYTVPISALVTHEPTSSAPYIVLASTIIVAAAATAVYVKRSKRRKEKQ
jgi:hypothetical protein